MRPYLYRRYPKEVAARSTTWLENVKFFTYFHCLTRLLFEQININICLRYVYISTFTPVYYVIQSYNKQ